MITEVRRKGQEVMILKGQDHSSWKYDIAQRVYQEALEILKESMENAS